MTIGYRKLRRLRKNNSFMVRVDSSAATKKILKGLGMIKQDGSFSFDFDDRIVNKKCCCYAFLRGAFLAAGSVSAPERGYHLEIVLSSQQHAVELQKLMSTHGLKSKYLNKKGRWIVYIKDSNDIATFLTMVGAVSAVLHFENVRIYKGMRNTVNRLVNCEAANVEKAALAAMEQIEVIKVIDREIGLNILSRSFSTLPNCVLHILTSLRELGQMLTPSVSKSCVNHRIRKISNS